MKKLMHWMLAAIQPLVFTMAFCGASVFTSCTSVIDNNPVTPVNPVECQYCATVQHLVTALDANPQVKQLVEKSIAKAKEINPNRVTNPAQTLTEFYDFLDWSLTRMPWDYFPEDLFHGFAEKTTKVFSILIG